MAFGGDDFGADRYGTVWIIYDYITIHYIYMIEYTHNIIHNDTQLRNTLYHYVVLSSISGQISALKLEPAEPLKRSWNKPSSRRRS